MQSQQGLFLLPLSTCSEGTSVQLPAQRRQLWLTTCSRAHRLYVLTSPGLSKPTCDPSGVPLTLGALPLHLLPSVHIPLLGSLISCLLGLPPGLAIVPPTQLASRETPNPQDTLWPHGASSWAAPAPCKPPLHSHLPGACWPHQGT